MSGIKKRIFSLFLCAHILLFAQIFCLKDVAAAETKRPNIMVIMGDDIGWFNVSAYNHGLMGYETPNINKLAKEGIMFTDAYGEHDAPPGEPPS